MIEVKNLKYKYSAHDKKWVLNGLSFNMRRGEKIALMGANGSGKTTLVRCLNGLLYPQQGEIKINGLHPENPDTISEIRRIVGMVFQNPDNQIVSTTIEREIAFGLENLGLPYHTIKEKVDKALIEFDLEPYRNFSPHLLSGGEKQRLAFASIWIMEPEFLILDETTSMLDYSLREQLFNFIKYAVVEKKMGILLVTQFPQEVLNFDRLIILDKGRIVRQGKPAELYQSEVHFHKFGIGLPVEVELTNYIKRKL